MSMDKPSSSGEPQGTSLRKHHRNRTQEVREPSEVVKLKEHLRTQKMRFDQLLEDFSDLPNKSEHITRLEESIEEKGQKLSNFNGRSIEDKRTFKGYTSDIDQLERYYLANLAERWNTQKARVGTLLQELRDLPNSSHESSHFRNIDPEHKALIKQLDEMGKSDIHRIDGKCPFVENYIFYADKLEAFTLKTHLDQIHTKAGQLLADFSDLPNKSENITRLEKSIEEKHQELSAFNGNSLESKKTFIKEYTSDIDQLERRYLVNLTECWHTQKARVGTLLQEIRDLPNSSHESSRFQNISQKHETLIRHLSNMRNNKLSDIHGINEKRSFVDKYTGYADQLEQLIHLDQQKAKAKQLLHTLSCLPHRSNVYQRWKEFFKESEREVFNGHITPKEYIDRVNYLEQYIHFKQQKVRTSELLDKFRDLPNMLNYVKESEEFLTELAIRTSRADDIEFKKDVDKYESHVDHIELKLHLEKQKLEAETLLGNLSNSTNKNKYQKIFKRLEDEISNDTNNTNDTNFKDFCIEQHATYIQQLRDTMPPNVQESASTSDNHTEITEITEIHPHTVVESVQADEIHEWHTNHRKVQISRLTRICDAILLKDTLSYKIRRIYKIRANINKKMDNIKGEITKHIIYPAINPKIAMDNEFDKKFWKYYNIETDKKEAHKLLDQRLSDLKDLLKDLKDLQK